MKKIAQERRMPAQTGEFVKDEQKDDLYRNQLDDVSFSPIFILGLHRSGTSILYKMLRSTGQFNCLTAYDVVYYNRLLYNKYHGLEEEFKNRFNNLIVAKDQKKRDIDRMSMNADFAIEYSFLLGPPYLFQRINQSNIDVFREVCKKVKMVKDKRKPLLLKNPWDFPNFLFIKKKLPNAKFIFIHRHPLDMINSSINALRIIVNQKTVYSDIFSPFAKKIDENPLLHYFLKILLCPIAPLGLPLIVENRAMYTNQFLRDIKKLNADSYILIRYEDLCEKTTETMNNIVKYLEIKGVNITSFEDFINPRDLTYTPDVQRMKSYILHRFTPYCSRFNYR